MTGELFVSERIRPCHAGGYWVSAEAIKVAGGTVKSVGSALGTAHTKWGARRKLRRYKREFASKADA
jgi:hypothetical protein